MCRHVLLAMTVVCLLNSEMCRGMAPPATRVSPDTPIPVLRQMSQEELLMTVVSGLQMRDAQLQNFSCELSYEVTYVDPQENRPKTQLLYKHFTVEKRLGRKSLIHDREFSPDGTSKFEYYMNWDGSRSLSLTLSRKGRAYPSGTINDAEPINMTGLYYNRLLGYRVGSADLDTLTLPEWIERAAKNATLQRVAVVEREGEALVEVHVLIDKYDNCRYWIDPARGYLPVRFEFQTLVNGKRSNWTTHWVAEAKKLAEVWVPMKILVHSGTSDPDYGIYVYSVSAFDIGTVQESDLEITFPAGTLVVDRVKHEAFRVNADGTRTLTELYNPLTGVVTLGDKKVGGSQRGPQSAATKPSSSGQDAASVPASVATGKGAGSSSMATIVGALAAAGALGLGVYLLFRHRTTATLVVILACAVVLAGHAQAAESAGNSIAAQLNARDATGIREAVASIRAMLVSDPGRAVDRLNEQWLVALLRAKQYEAVLEFSATGTIALPADTWRIEQLHRHRIRAYLETNRPKEALAAAKGLYNVCGSGFVPTALDLMAECLKAAHSEEPGIASRFKLQQLGGAQTDPKEREKALKGLGESVMAGVPADPKPWEKAIQDRKGKEEYRALYGTGNLLLLAGRTKEAKEVFEKVYAIAPPGEIRYASEGLAKAMKAEDGFIGRANAWILSGRPKQ